MKRNTLKFLGIACTIFGAALTIFEDYIEDKEMEEKIQDEVQRQLAQAEEERDF